MTSHDPKPLGRSEIVLIDEPTGSVLVLDLVFRSEDVTVWLGNRTLAVISRDALAAWLDAQAEDAEDLVIDDLAWSAAKGRSLPICLTIDGHRTYALDDETLADLQRRT